jgi:hypothetical protein
MRCSSAEWIARNGCCGWVPWDDAIVVSAGKLRKLWDSLSELRNFLCERRLDKTVMRTVLLSENCALYSVFPSSTSSHSKIAQLNWECIGSWLDFLSDTSWIQTYWTLVWVLKGLWANCSVP